MVQYLVQSVLASYIFNRATSVENLRKRAQVHLRLRTTELGDTERLGCTRVKLPPQYLPPMLSTVNLILIVSNLTRPGIELESTVSEADLLSTRPLIG